MGLSSHVRPSLCISSLLLVLIPFSMQPGGKRDHLFLLVRIFRSDSGGCRFSMFTCHPGNHSLIHLLCRCTTTPSVFRGTLLRGRRLGIIVASTWLSREGQPRQGSRSNQRKGSRIQRTQQRAPVIRCKRQITSCVTMMCILILVGYTMCTSTNDSQAYSTMRATCYHLLFYWKVF